MRKRICLTSVLVFLTAAIIGIGSRKWDDRLPGFLAAYTGDAMWALAFFALFRGLSPRLRLGRVVALTAGFSLLIELSQLWHPAWLDRIRATLPGGLLLGFGFRWSDLVCYAAGCVIGLLIFFIVESVADTDHF